MQEYEETHAMKQESSELVLRWEELASNVSGAITAVRANAMCWLSVMCTGVRGGGSGRGHSHRKGQKPEVRVRLSRVFNYLFCLKCTYPNAGLLARASCKI